MAARPWVRIVGTQRGGIVRGTATPGAAIEAVNLSQVPADRVLPVETAILAHADERGRFAARLPMRPHDLVRVRARSPSGTTGAWTTFRARLGGTRRPTCVAVFRLGLRDLENGYVEIFAIARARPIAEPHAKLSIVNTRTGDRVLAVTNAAGRLSRRVRIPGAAGDHLRVEAGGRIAGTLLTPSAKLPPGLVRPSGFHQKLGFVPAARRFDAPLFEERPRPFDVLQSELSDCYLASAAAAIAHVRPDCLERAIVPIGQGTYRVRFRTGRRHEPFDVVVTSELYVRPSGELLYGSSAWLRDPPSLWWPVLEKAFARLKGSYRCLGRGGTSHRVLELLLGRPPRHFYVDPTDPEALWRELVRALVERLPVVAGTSPPWTARKFVGTGLVPDHAYAVLRCREVRGVRKILVRNPWGEDVRPPRRARKNGSLEIGLDEFVRLFQVVSTVR